jgi:acyl-CoA synthetase (AMP-forming)/AMP-acid ligase II
MKRFFNSQSFLIVLLAATIAGSLVYFLNTQQRKLNVGLMVQSARMQAELLTNVRGFYLKEIVQRVAGSDVTVTHDFRTMEKAIPIPATMTLELSEYLNARSSDITTALVSEYPFSLATKPPTDTI